MVSAAKPATWARALCSPVGSTRPSVSPAWTVSSDTWGLLGNTSGHLCVCPMDIHCVDVLCVIGFHFPIAQSPKPQHCFQYFPNACPANASSSPCLGTHWCQASDSLPVPPLHGWLLAHNCLLDFPLSTLLSNPAMGISQEPPVLLLLLPCKGCEIKASRRGEKQIMSPQERRGAFCWLTPGTLPMSNAS